MVNNVNNAEQAAEANTEQTTSSLQTEPETTETQPKEKTYTEAELRRRIVRATKDMPDKEELARFRAWQEAQKTEADRVAGIIAERDALQAELDKAHCDMERIEHERYVFDRGITGYEAKFVAFQAEQMVDDATTFEAAVDKVLAEKAKTPSFDWSVPVGIGKNPESESDKMNRLIRGSVFG